MYLFFIVLTIRTNYSYSYLLYEYRIFLNFRIKNSVIINYFFIGNNIDSGLNSESIVFLLLLPCILVILLELNLINAKAELLSNLYQISRLSL